MARGYALLLACALALLASTASAKVVTHTFNVNFFFFLFFLAVIYEVFLFGYDELEMGLVHLH